MSAKTDAYETMICTLSFTHIHCLWGLVNGVGCDVMIAYRKTIISKSRMALAHYNGNVNSDVSSALRQEKNEGCLFAGLWKLLATYIGNGKIM